MICGSTSYLYFWFSFFFSRCIIGQCPGSFVLLGVCGKISSPLSENIMEGTDCEKLLVTHLNWFILYHTCECMQSMEYTILWCQGGLC